MAVQEHPDRAEPLPGHPELGWRHGPSSAGRGTTTVVTTSVKATGGRLGTRARKGVRPAAGEVRVLVCTPQLMVRQALTAVLASSPRLRVVGDVGTGKDALRWSLEVRPDITLLDSLLSPLDGVHAATAIHAEDPGLKLVTLRDDDVDLGDLDDGGAAAAARVSKRLSTHALVDVLLRVADGEAPGDVPEVVPGPPTPVAATTASGLKDSERVLLELLVGGSDNRVLAERLGCSEKTVRNRLSDLYAKLHLHNRTQAALYAVRSGLVDPAGVAAGD